jgi:hypothetical protein
MFVPAAQVGDTLGLACQRDLLQLRNRNTQRLSNPAKAGLLRAIRRFRDGLREIAAKRIVDAAHGPVRFPDKLWNDVQVTHGLEE